MPTDNLALEHRAPAGFELFWRQMKSLSSQSIPILMYHEVASTTELGDLRGKTQHSYVISRDNFRRQMQRLRDLGAQALSMDEMYDWLGGRFALPQRPVAITFDDGFAGNERHALPILREFGFKATFFVVSNKIGAPSMMTPEQLRGLAAAGMAVQSHTANHPLLSRLDYAQTRRELEESKLALEDVTGVAVRHLSLPNGDSNGHYRNVANELGYLTGCGSEFGLNDTSADALFLRRIAVKGGTTSDTIAALVNQDRQLLRRLRTKARLKALIPGIIGKSRYDRLYNFVFNVEQQDESLSR